MNEVEETLRALNAQMEHTKKEFENLNEAFEEFTKTCKPILDESYFVIICNMFENCIDYYKKIYNDSSEAKIEVIEKYKL